MTDAIRQLEAAIPSGVGLGLRPALWDATLAAADEIDFVEITIDDYLRYPVSDVREWFRPVQERFDIVAHGVGLSVASADRLDEEYLDDVARVLDALEIEAFTEHCSFVRSRGHEIGQFLPVPFTEKWAERVAERVVRVQRHLGRPLALENVSYVIGRADDGLGEGDFFAKILEEADCGLLLDVTNLAVNAANHHYDPLDFLEAIPGQRAVVGHVAGGHTDRDFYVDSHGHPIRDESLGLLAEVSEQTSLQGIVVERDKNFPDMRDVLDEIEEVREAMAGEPPPDASIELPALREPEAGEAPTAEGLDAEVLQTALCFLFGRAGRWKSLRQRRAFPEGFDPEVDEQEREPLIDYLLAFSRPQVRLFSKILRYKRREKIEGVLPGTCRVFEERLPELLDPYFRRQPDQSRERAEEGIAFAEYLLERDDLSDVERDLIVHEKTVLELRARPYRFWRIFSQRQRRRLSCHPRGLSEVVRGDASLPEPEDQPVEVRYRRKPEGVLVEVVG